MSCLRRHISTAIRGTTGPQTSARFVSAATCSKIGRTIWHSDGSLTGDVGPSAIRSRSVSGIGCRTPIEISGKVVRDTEVTN